MVEEVPVDELAQVAERLAAPPAPPVEQSAPQPLFELFPLGAPTPLEPPPLIDSFGTPIDPQLVLRVRFGLSNSSTPPVLA